MKTCPYSAEQREGRLASLALLRRVWPGDSGGPCDTTPGLIQLCREWIRPDWSVVEVGSFRGVSTRVIACFAAQVWAVDPWTLATEYRDIPAEVVAQAEVDFALACLPYPNITAVRCRSLEAASWWPPASVDCVYLDGDHSPGAFAGDVAAWASRLTARGILCGHDFAAVGPCFAPFRLPAPVALYPDDSWVIRAADLPRPPPQSDTV